VAAVAPAGSLAALWPVGLVVLLVATLFRKAEFAEIVPAAAATFLGASYLGTLGGTLAALRSLPPASDGAWRLTLLMATIMVADTFAFFAGKRDRAPQARAPDLAGQERSKGAWPRWSGASWPPSSCANWAFPGCRSSTPCSWGSP